jgi:hypothetical protein
VLADLLTPVTTLAAVLVGGYIAQAGQASSWRRERRADAYAAVITEVDRLGQRLVDMDFNDPGRELDVEDVVTTTAPLEAKVSLASLYAGPRVDEALRELVKAAFHLDSGSKARRTFFEAGVRVRASMREELHGTRLARRALRRR